MNGKSRGLNAQRVILGREYKIRPTIRIIEVDGKAVDGRCKEAPGLY
jgi:hypothetical protein